MDYDSNDNCVTFIWKIYNFSHCTQKKGVGLRSPSFFVNNSEFALDLYPRGTRKKHDYIGFELIRRCADYGAQYSFVFSLSTLTGSFENSMVWSLTFHAFSWWTYAGELFLTVPGIHKRRNISISDSDTLIVKCKILKVNEVPMHYKKIFNAHTIIDVKKTSYSWNVNTFIYSKQKTIYTKELNLFDNTSFTIDVSWVNSDQDFFEIVIRRTKANELHFYTCTLSLLDKERVLQTERHEHWCENEQGIEHLWKISFTPKMQLKSYDQKDTFLRLEFGVKGIETSGINKIEHGTSIKHHPFTNHPAASVSSICTQTPAVSVSSICTQTLFESSKSWKDNLHRFYADGTLSDVTIRTPTKEFPVHKALLCAQSEVFTAMFERNMTEKETGIIDIDDSNDETISKMLLYIYGGLVENLDWESALNLYSAAHKYRIAALCEQCLDFLKDHLSTLNFYECLHIADLYQDQTLKSVAQKFVMEHSNEVINSEEWTQFMNVNLSLAAETMCMCFKNSKNP